MTIIDPFHFVPRWRAGEEEGGGACGDAARDGCDQLTQSGIHRPLCRRYWRDQGRSEGSDQPESG